MPDLSYGAWLEQVLDSVNGRCGLSRMEAEGFACWRSWYGEGLSVAEAVAAYEENFFEQRSA